MFTSLDRLMLLALSGVPDANWKMITTINATTCTLELMILSLVLRVGTNSRRSCMSAVCGLKNRSVSRAKYTSGGASRCACWLRPLVAVQLTGRNG